MKLCNLLSGVSLGVLAFAAFETPARAQEQLPTIDVGAARPVAGGPGEGQGTNPGIAAAGSGSDTGGYGGAGPAQDPYNKTYVLRERQRRHQDRYAGHGHAAERSVGQPAGAAGSADHRPRPGVARTSAA